MPETWNFMQWKFTACRYNMENANGFNTFSMSDGLTRDDKEDLIRGAGSYTPPDHLPYQPTDDEIRDLFPVMFSAFTLRSGKRAVVRTVYVGKDYAGVRWGNFFSHGLILPAGAWPFYPIQLWDSRVFADGLSADELALEATPPPLPEITVTQDDLYDFSAEIPAFLSDDPARSEALLSLLTAVRNVQASAKTVLLRDDGASAPLWMAAIQYAFPRRVAGTLAFTTYAHSPAGAQMFQVSAVPPEGSAFAFNSPTLAATHRVFDFPENRLPAIPPKFRLYTDLLRTDELAYPGNEMQELHTFTDTLACNLSDDSLEKAVLLFRFLEKNSPPKDEKTFQTLLAFLAAQPLRARQTLTKQLLEKRQIFPLKILETLLPGVLKTLTESQLHPLLLDPFCDFFAAQFACAPAELTAEQCQAWFAFLARILETLPRGLDETLLEHARDLLAQSPQPGHYAFYYYALLLLRLADDPARFEQEMSRFPQLSDEEFRIFHDATLELAVSRASLPEMHRLVVRFFCKPGGQFLPYHAERYLEILCRRQPKERHMRYGSDRWKFGKAAQPQATAFMLYVLKTPTQEWATWRNEPAAIIYFRPGRVLPFWKSKRDSAFRRNQLWALFGMDRDLLEMNASVQKRKKRWQYIHNIRKILRPLCPLPVSNQNTRLRELGLPSRWNVWRSTVMQAGLALGLAVALAIIVCFAIFSAKGIKKGVDTVKDSFSTPVEEKKDEPLEVVVPKATKLEDMLDPHYNPYENE